MKSGRLDRRVQYTKMVLKLSLVHLMAEKPVGRVTIKEICERADVNRGTFYTHYADQYDLLEEIEDDLDGEIKAALAKNLPNSSNVTMVVAEILTAVAARATLCQVLFSDHGDATFVNKIMSNTRAQFLAEWSTKVHPEDVPQLDRFYVFTANGIAAVIRDWLRGGTVETPAAIASFVQKTIDGGLASFVDAPV